MFYVYILFSTSLQKYYTGQTKDIQKRLEEHNRGKTPYMAKGKPWELVYSVCLSSRAEAMTLEKKIKKRGASRFLFDSI